MVTKDRNPTPPEPVEGPDVEDISVEDIHLSSDSERAAVIASVMRHQAQQRETQSTVTFLGTKPLLPQLTTLALATALAVFVWFGSPRWLEPEAIPLPTLEVEEDLVRSAVFLQAERIQAYRLRNGRLPAFLREAGPELPGVQYRRLDNRTYRIHGWGDRLSFTYTSGEPLDEFQASFEALLGSTLDQ